jgi:nucleoside phosphorylase
MRILVTFAVDAEFAPWREMRTFREVKANPDHYSGGRNVYQASIGANTVWVFLTGIGIKSFDFESACCFVDGGVETVISSGLAGALSSGLAVEQIVVPKRVKNLKDTAGLPVSADLAAAGERRGARAIASMLTADHIVATHEEKSRLSQFAEAVDMESFHVVAQFTGDKVPVAVIRAISDGSAEDLPIDFEKCITPEGRVKPGPLVSELLGRPTKLPGLIRFGRQSRSAAKQLATFLDGYIGGLTPDILCHRPPEVEAS